MKHFPAALRTALCTAFCLLFLAGAPCLADEWNDSFSPPRPYRVLRDIAVRGGPGNQHERLGSVSEGDVLRVQEIVNGWNRFDFQGRQGWLFKRYLRPMAAGEPEQPGSTSPDTAPQEQPPQEQPPAPLPDPFAPAEPDTAAPAEPDPTLPTLPTLPVASPAPVPAEPDPLTQALEEIARGQISEPPTPAPEPAPEPAPVPAPALDPAPPLVPAEPLPPAEPSPDQPPHASEALDTPRVEIEPGLPQQPEPAASAEPAASVEPETPPLPPDDLADEAETPPMEEEAVVPPLPASAAPAAPVEPETPPLPPDDLADETETPPMEEEAVVPPLPASAAPVEPGASFPPSEEEGEYVAALQPRPEASEKRLRPKRAPAPGDMLEHGCERFISIIPEEKSDAVLTAVLQGQLSPGGQTCYRLLALADWNVSALLQAPEGASFDIFTPEQGRVAASMRAWAQLMQVSGDKYFVIRAGEAPGAFTFELTVR